MNKLKIGFKKKMRMKKFQELERDLEFLVEKLLQSTFFGEYKNKMVQYSKDFITDYLN